jgi:hypothetical protein
MKACTSSHLLGKDRLRLSKSPGLLHIGWLTSMVLKYPTSGILISLGVSTRRAHKKDMYPSCTLIISIKQLCFVSITLICLFGDYSSTDILQIS